MKQRIALILAMLLVSGEAFSWGANGHRVVGQIAQEHLTRKAKKKIEKLLDCDPLAEVANWMDDIKSDDAYNNTHDWHWVTIPDNMEYGATDKNPNGDVIAKTEEIIAALKAGNLPVEKEKEYLKYLVHLVGDLHQPLHVGGGDDAGGNKVYVKWFGESSNLHRVWDSEMIDSKSLSFTELVTFIGEPTKSEIEKWQSTPVEGWAKESMTYRPRFITCLKIRNLDTNTCTKTLAL